jgi:hypothetical protein
VFVYRGSQLIGLYTVGDKLMNLCGELVGESEKGCKSGREENNT